MADKAFNDFKRDIKKAIMHSIDKKYIPDMETATFDTSIAVILNHVGCLVVSSTCTLTPME